uniref:1-alkyl-2-acetylglycerophosphocholine esterase n=1 Tax=Scleropages formosus TaxID=113540 RepID=A0A8D0CHJ2_SCLFO
MKINRSFAERIFNYLYGKRSALSRVALMLSQNCAIEPPILSRSLCVGVCLTCILHGVFMYLTVISCYTCLNFYSCKIPLALTGSYRIPAFWEAPFKSNGKYPLVIFSHGLGAFRTLYSAICAELASRGFVVASVEHRDESGSATFYFKENSQMQQQENLEKVWMYYRALKPGEEEFSLRNNQVQQRANECIRALKILDEINSGKSVTNVLQSEFDWSSLKNSLDLCKTAVMGHSFGGATVIETLCKELTFKCGVALDTWMVPLKEEIFPNVKQPILFINSEKFQWAGNIIRMRKLDSASIQRKMITIRGTVHQSFPDFTFLTGNWIGKVLKLKGDIDPHLAMDLSNKASLAFLQRHLSLDKDFNQWDPLIDGKDENLIPGTNIHVPSSSM